MQCLKAGGKAGINANLTYLQQNRTVVKFYETNRKNAFKNLYLLLIVRNMRQCILDPVFMHRAPRNFQEWGQYFSEN